MTPRGYKIKDVATMLSYSRSTIYELIKAGKLQTYRTGEGSGGMRVRADSVEAFIAGGEEWPAKAQPAAPKAKARTGQTASGTSTDTKAGQSQTLKDRGQPLSLKL